jgi:hypothetical protein
MTMCVLIEELIIYMIIMSLSRASVFRPATASPLSTKEREPIAQNIA